MGVLYRKHCKNCDTSQNVSFDGFVGATVTDNRPGEIVAAGHAAYIKHDGDRRYLVEIVDLPPENDQYEQGERQKCRFRFIVY